MSDLRLILVTPQPDVMAAFGRHFAGLPRVEIVFGGFQDLPAFDCMVSPANSFGLMDGGVDAAIIRFFGLELERRVQLRVLADFRGEQPVGTAFVVETGHPRHPYLVHAPTMRVPMEIARTDNVYRAMWATLLAVHRHNSSTLPAIGSVACPGLGTGAGQVPAGEAARQMALAYRYFLDPPQRIDWRMADARQDAIRYGGDLGLHMAPKEE